MGHWNKLSNSIKALILTPTLLGFLAALTYGAHKILTSEYAMILATIIPLSALCVLVYVVIFNLLEG